MQEAEEQDTCRICGAPAEPDQPLFYPCKCSGTIRYIHQDCLTTWLAHSKKKNCDVCKHPYSFTKVYALDMPKRLPIVLLARRLAQQALFGVLFGIRGIIVAIIWLAVLPYITVWTWRMYFSMGESTAWWISDRPRPPSSESSTFPIPFSYPSATNPVPPPPHHGPSFTFFGIELRRLTTHPLYRSVSADIFTGQIIASLIVLTFVAVFLLREWISQNARPGVFEDDDVLMEPQPQPEGPAAANQGRIGNMNLDNPPPMPIPIPNLNPDHLIPNQIRGRIPNEDQRRMEEYRTIVAIEAKHAHHNHFHAPVRDRDDAVALKAAAIAAGHRRRRALRQIQNQNRGRIRIGSGKGKEKRHDENGAESEDADGRYGVMPARSRRRMELMEDEVWNGKTPLEDWPGLEDINPDRDADRREKSQVEQDIQVGPSESGLDSVEGKGKGKNATEPAHKFSFTFKARAAPPAFGLPSPVYTPNEPIPRGLTDHYGRPIKPFNFVPPAKPSLPSFTPAPAPTLASAPVPSPTPSTPESTYPPHSTLFSFGSIPPQIPRTRRPPLPSTSTLSSPMTEAGPSNFSAVDPSVSTPPLDSPSLATYRAPEELGGSGSGVGLSRGYFDGSDLKQKQKEEIIEASDVIPNGEDEDKGARDNETEHDHDTEDSDLKQKEYEKYFADRDRLVEKEEILPLLLSEDESGEEEEEEGGDGGDFEFEREGDDEEGEEDPWVPNPEAERRDAPPPQAEQEDPAQPGPDAAADIPVAEGVDEMEGNVEDDMEGAMEAIGMRGPIYGVVQNAALMIFVLDTAIGLGVWIPFTIGKSTALLALDPHRFLQILHLPIRAIRILTDPVVDSIVYLVFHFVFPSLFRIGRRLFNLFFLSSLFFIGKIFGSKASNRILESTALLTVKMSRFVDKPWDRIAAWISASSKETALPNTANNTHSGIVANMVDRLEPHFATLGKEVRLGAVRFQMTWKRLALGEGPSERAFAVILGYAVVGLMLSLYLNILTVGNVKSAGRAVRSAVRQQLLVLKVAAFIFIELVTFPLGCGIVLDVSTVWLFPEANLLSRATFFFQAPLTAMFYHWVAGTMFMYSFAVLLSGCRSIMRPGAMWFIKDPQDQNSHPIRDILDRPTFTQLRKICVSGLMYSFVVVCVVGSVAGLLLLGSKSIMPFRWKNREPLSNVPIDLLFLHLVLPYTMHYFRPRKALKRLATSLWKYLAAKLRLTSYFFGGQHPEEEYTPNDWKLFKFTQKPAEGEVVWDGTFRRVPATDNVALPRDMRATVQVNKNGQPISDADSELMAQQNAEALKAKRRIEEDYTIAYFPPFFRYRIFLFIFLLWVVGAVFLGVMVALPIQLGRSFFKLFVPRDVHDGYSLIIGFYLLWACYLVAKAVDRLDKRRQRRGEGGPRADLRILVIKRGLLWTVKILYMMLFLGVVVPTLIAFVVDLYIVLPIRFTLNPDLAPRIRVVDAWALGLLYAKIAMHIHRAQPPSRITRGLQNIMNNGWTHPDPVTATKEIICPVSGGLICMILLPAMVCRAVQYFVPYLALDDKFIFMHVYPGIFMVAGLIRSGIVLFDILSSWSQTIRDTEFLVEMRLRNHEPDSSTGKFGDLKTVEGVTGGELEDSDNEL